MSLLWTTATTQVEAAYYHGTDEDFEPGDLIHPQSETGAKNWAQRLYERTGESFYKDLADAGSESGAMGPYSGHHVYHTDAPHEARDFGRNVYEVEPLTKIEHDPEQPKNWTRNKGPVRVVREV